MTLKKIVDKAFCIGKDPVDMTMEEFDIWIRKRNRNNEIMLKIFLLIIISLAVILVLSII